jgi:hypothetical protein
LLAVQNDDKRAEVKTCGLTVQFEELAIFQSLKESITNCSCITSVLTGTYEAQTVFYVAVTDPLCNGIFAPTLYNGDGEVVRVFKNTLEEQDEFFQKVEARRSLHDGEN